jgi:hypothetical protein
MPGTPADFRNLPSGQAAPRQFQIGIGAETTEIFRAQPVAGLLASPTQFSDDAHHMINAYAVSVKFRIRAAPGNSSQHNVMRTHVCSVLFKVFTFPEKFFESPWSYQCPNA